MQAPPAAVAPTAPSGPAAPPPVGLMPGAPQMQQPQQWTAGSPGLHATPAPVPVGLPPGAVQPQATGVAQPQRPGPGGYRPQLRPGMVAPGGAAAAPFGAPPTPPLAPGGSTPQLVLRPASLALRLAEAEAASSPASGPVATAGVSTQPAAADTAPQRQAAPSAPAPRLGPCPTPAEQQPPLQPAPPPRPAPRQAPPPTSSISSSMHSAPPASEWALPEEFKLPTEPTEPAVPASPRPRQPPAPPRGSLGVADGYWGEPPSADEEVGACAGLASRCVVCRSQLCASLTTACNNSAVYCSLTSVALWHRDPAWVG